MAVVRVGIGHRDHDRHVDAAADAVEDAARRRRIDNHAGRALHLGIHGEVHDALARRQPAADTDEHRQVTRHEQRLRDDRLRRERVDRKHRVGVDIADDGQVGREHQRLDAPPENADAAALADAAGHLNAVLAQLPLINRYKLLHRHPSMSCIIRHIVAYLPVSVNISQVIRQIFTFCSFL